MSQAPKSSISLYWILKGTPAIDMDLGLYIEKTGTFKKIQKEKKREQKQPTNTRKNQENSNKRYYLHNSLKYKSLRRFL